VLRAVIGLFSGRGYNSIRWTVSETEHEKQLVAPSHRGLVERDVIEQIKNQLERLVPDPPGH
jgi:acetolactate synthase small subunit